MSGKVRRRQRLSVKLAVRRQRHLLHDDEKRRHHVSRQLLFQKIAQPINRRSLSSFRDDVRHQTLLTGGVFSSKNRGILHVWMAAQHRFDFTQLNTKAANLNLIIIAAEKINTSIRQIASQVSRLVKSRVQLVAERIGNKFLARQLGPVQVTPREAVPADVQFSRYADRNRLQMAVEHVKLRVGDGPADGDGPVCYLRFDFAGSRPDRSFGGAVQIPKRCASFQQLVRQFPIQGLAAAQDFEPIVALPARFQQQSPRGWSRLHHRSARVRQLLRQPSSIRSHFPADQRQMRAHTQRQKHFQRRNIKRQCSNREQYILFHQPRLPAHRRQEVDDRAMRNLHSLRLPRRPRSVDHIGQVVGGR